MDVSGVEIAEQLEQSLARLGQFGIAPHGSRFFNYSETLRNLASDDPNKLRAEGKDGVLADAMMESADLMNALRLPDEYLASPLMRADLEEILKGPVSQRGPTTKADGGRNKLFQFATAAWLHAHNRLGGPPSNLADTSYIVEHRTGPVECKRISSQKKEALYSDMREAVKQISRRCHRAGVFGVVALDVSRHIAGGFRLDHFQDMDEVRQRAAAELDAFCNDWRPVIQHPDIATNKVLGLLIRHVVQGRVGSDIRRCTEWTTIPCHPAGSRRGKRFGEFREPMTPSIPRQAPQV